VTRPEGVTVTRDWSEVVHVTSDERVFPETSLTVAVSETVALGTSVAADVDSVTEAISGAVGDSFPPQASVIAAAAARESLPRASRRVMVQSSPDSLELSRRGGRPSRLYRAS
jgi:hypothetical protein